MTYTGEERRSGRDRRYKKGLQKFGAWVLIKKSRTRIFFVLATLGYLGSFWLFLSKWVLKE